MITIEEKLNLFTNMVLDKAKKEYDLEAERLNNEVKEKIEAYKSELNREKEKLIRDMEKKGKEEKARLISHANINKMKAVHNKQNEILEQVYKTLMEKAHSYTDSEEYQEFFETVLNKAYNSFANVQGLIFHVSEKDSNRFSEMIYKAGEKNQLEKDSIQIKISDEDLIGGLACTDDKKSYKIDLSIISIIKNNENYIGTELFNALKGADGTDD